MCRVVVALLVGFLALEAPLWAQGPFWQGGVVQIRSKTEQGTGFVVAQRNENVYIVTAAHVVEGDPKPTVEFAVAPDNQYTAVVRHVEAGEERGLALLVVAKPPAGVIVLGEGSKPAISDRVVVAGFPVDPGTFSILDPSIKTIQGRDLFLTRDAERGFSGGPVLRDGAVVGLVYGKGGSGRALRAENIRAYLSGHGLEWSSSSAVGTRVATAVSTYQNPKDGLTYVWIAPGSFKMGCSENPRDSECGPDEMPTYDVEITRGFWLGETEVTQAAWKRVMKTDPSHFRGDDRPVERVSWEEANAYCHAIGGRLPTEAEWEFAARAGTTGAQYGELGEIAWYGDNSGRETIDTTKLWSENSEHFFGMLEKNGNGTHRIGTRRPNAWRLHDMLGNVWEWVADWYGRYPTSRHRDPAEPAHGSERTVRGGAWVNLPKLSACRGGARSRRPTGTSG